MRLIDADKLLRDIEKYHVSDGKFQHWVQIQPTIDPETCEDAVSINAIIQKLNTMDRYVSEELRLCDTDKKFPKNEVFIVDDVYEEIVEQLPSAQPEITDCDYCHEDSDGYVTPLEKNCHAFVTYSPIDGWILSLKANGWHGEARIKFCPMCGRRLGGQNR